MMSRIYTLLPAILLLLAGQPGLAQAPDWQWAKSAGNMGQDMGYNIAVDAAGNSYITGNFRSATIAFGNFILTRTDTSDLSGDIFIVKYNASGTVIWAKSVGGNQDDGARSIVLNPNGEIYITGYFYSDTLIFGGDTLIVEGGVASSGFSYSDFFVAKYDSSGNAIWGNSARGNSHDSGFDIAVDNYGNSYIIGKSQSNIISFDTTTFNSAIGSHKSFFVVKYDNMGNLKWVKNSGNGFYEFPSIAIDAVRNFYVAGTFQGHLSIGNIVLHSNLPNIFHAKYDSSGNFIWANAIVGDLGYDYSNDIVVDQQGNSYMTGYFRSTYLNFNGIILTNMVSNGHDFFLAKHDSSGNVVWAKNVGSAGTVVEGNSICLDATGDLLATGSLGGDTVNFDNIMLVPPDSGEDIFIVKYDTSGNALWAKCTGGNGDYITSQGIGTDASGKAYVTGYFICDSIAFGNTTLINAGATSPGGSIKQDIFLVKLDSAFFTGITEQSNYSFALFVHPNPAKENIECRMQNSELRDVTLQIFNMLGTLVATHQLENNTTTKTIDVSSLASGVYAVRLVSEAGSVSKKFVKE